MAQWIVTATYPNEANIISAHSAHQIGSLHEKVDTFSDLYVSRSYNNLGFVAPSNDVVDIVIGDISNIRIKGKAGEGDLDAEYSSCSDILDKTHL